MKRLGALLALLGATAFFSLVSAQKKGQLEVVMVSPKGETASIDQTQTIFASFNQPMVALRESSTGEAGAPLLIYPKVKGRYQWLGTKTIALFPSDTLPCATSFVIRIPAGTRSLSGRILASEYRWQFETPRPRVVSHVPYDGQKFVELDHSIIIRFNQKIDPRKTSEFISLEESVGSGIAYPPFNARRPQAEELSSTQQYSRSAPDPEKSLLLVPLVPMSKSARYTVRCKAGLPGAEGSLGMSAEYSFSFSTFNELACLGVAVSDGWSPSQPLRLLFSNPVSIQEVARQLVLEPPVQISPDQLGYDYQTEEPRLSLPLEADKEYRGIVKAGLKDRFGNALTRDISISFRTGSFTPYVRMTTGPGVVEGSESHKYPVTFMNTDSVRLELGAISPERIVPLMSRLDFSSRSGLAEEEGALEEPEKNPEQSKDLTISRIWRVKGSRNRQVVRLVDLDEVLRKTDRGIVLVQVDNVRPEPDRRYWKALLQVTDIAITAKFSPESNLMWVTKLNDASPVSDAAVEIRNDSNEVVWSGKTDPKGMVRSPGWGSFGLRSPNEWQQPRQWVIVRKGDDIAFTSSDWQQGIEPWSFGIQADWNATFEPLQGSVFTDRGLYKAGESVEIKGIVRVRKEGSWRIPKGGSVRVTVHNSRNEEIHTSEQMVSPFGSFALSVPLTSSSPLGYYTMLIESRSLKGGKEEWDQIGSGSFRVEAFRPAEFEVTARSGKTSYVVGDTFTGYLSARYLFGGALKKESVTWRLSTTMKDWNPPGWPKYFFGPLTWLSKYVSRTGYQVLASKQQRLDDAGSIQVQSELRVGEIIGTASLMFEGDVTAPSRQQISGRTSAIVHGGEFYIGISPSTTFMQTDSTLRYDVITVTPEGNILPDVSLRTRVVRRMWRSVRKAESGGRYAWMSEPEDITVDSALLRSSEKPVQLSFRTNAPGVYYIQAEGKDDRGNALVTHAYFYVSGSGYVAWERNNDDRLELVSDKSSFDPGEVAHILVKSPYERATALITVEREGILQHWTRTLVGSAPQIDLPIQKEHLPNIFVSVVLLQGRKSSGPEQSGGTLTREADVGRPSFKVGYAKLTVSPKEKHLSVLVTPDRKEYHPGDSVQIRIRVRDDAGNGIPSEVTLSVADRGVLNLLGYRLPDPFDVFYAERSLSVRTTETRIHLVEQRSYGEKGEDTGGGGAEEKMFAAVDAEGMRRDFRPTAYWNPSLLTDSRGEAAVRFKLPDNLTTFQVMGVAQTLSSEFGFGEGSFSVNKPLLLQPSLPRFVRAGDVFEGGVVVHNYSDEEKSVLLLTRATGVKFLGRDTSLQKVRPGQAIEVRYKWIAERAGKATFMFRGTTEADGDGVQWTIPIQAARLPESVALYESTSDSLTRERVAVPRNAHKDTGEVRVQVASTPLIGLSGGASYLFTYPYGCLEQRLSGILPIILARDLIEAFNLDVFKDKDYRGVVAKTLDELSSFQQPNGGFAYWKNDQSVVPFVSAYAVYTLVQARRNGYSVDARSVDLGMKYLQRVLKNEEPFLYYNRSAWSCTHSLILYVFARMGRPDYGYMEKLYKSRAELPLFAKAYLLRALRAAEGNAAMIQELARDLTNRAKVSPSSAHFEERDPTGLAWVFDSNVRSSALVLQALVEAQPENPLAPKVVHWLLDQRNNGMWRTTQENLYVIDALSTYFRVYEKEEPDFRLRVSVAGKNVLKELFAGRSLRTAKASIPLTELNLGTEQQIEFRKEGRGLLHYGVMLTYSPKGDTKAKDEGLTVVKSLEAVPESTSGRNTFRPGSVVKVTLTVVSNQARNFLVVRDPLPAGFEAINTSFETAASNLAQLLRRDNTELGWVAHPFNHTEMHDDHVLLFADFFPAGVYSFIYLARATSVGQFRMPSTRAEGMYEPEVFGQTGSQTITVK